MGLIPVPSGGKLIICSPRSITGPHVVRAHQKADPSPSTSSDIVPAARRGLVLSAALFPLLLAVATADEIGADDSRTRLLEKYLKKSQENKAKNDNERLESYYRRNYKDYFDSVEASARGKKELTESEKGILQWLRKHR